MDFWSSFPIFNFMPNANMFNCYAFSPMSMPFFDFSSGFYGGGGDTFVRSTDSKSSITPRTDGDFDKMLKFVLSVEGGYTDNDCGQAGNKGILQSTYDSYRKSKGLATNPVKNITDEEVKDLYYNMFYKASGADKVKDSTLALYVFDTAVNMGVGAAKSLLSQCGGSSSKFKQLRLARYESIATNKPAKAKFLTGWKNRVTKAESFAGRELA